MQPQPIKRVVIAGGGTAGWMCAASLAKLMGKNLEIQLVESDAIGTVGVGEATIPPLLTLHKLLGINEQEFMAATQATFKLGIDFENWKNVDESYIHSFGTTGQDHWAAGFQHFWLRGQQMGLAKEYGVYCAEFLAAQQNKFAVLPNMGLNYAFHLDATLYAKFLREIAQKHGANRTEGKIDHVELCKHSGYIKALRLESGQVIEGDLFIDCTGFRALLIEETLHTGYDDWTHWLPCDRAIAVQTQAVETPRPYTRSIAHPSGWQWRIPLQHRVGNGLVYCSRYLNDEDAKELLLNNVEGEVLTDPRVIRFRTGQRRSHWNKNCIAIGLSSGFIEPLESTSIHLIQRGIVRLMQMFPANGIVQADVNEFNAQTEHEVKNIRDFIILHYHVTQREDSAFWRYCKNMPIPDSLKHRLALFKQTGRVFKVPNELFGENSWVQVMLGQGLVPESHHPIADLMNEKEMEHFLSQIEQQNVRKVSQLPSHYEFLQHYCPSQSPNNAK
ncbi:tryptophan halogenase family protein [Alteromonas sp. ASW11-130]|uniref:tryptophan halogenase family protein n=1 Tax=Alteromonas sp. ASW11-130 TaxID=3015775 RepID=UPI002241BB6D|nr:tryptophan halogenase family protein [Alteromonas sp. ASW11-130]MCW8092958.1 tryptophan 7-halogenase [Alteromonas sp. ASW11-130]